MSKSKGRVLLLDSEGIGKGDETLSYEILVTMLETLLKREDRPTAIICWNTAVKLLSEGSPLISHFKRLEERGVIILAGQLCVRDLELLDKIEIGKLATMDEILDLILHNDVISL